MNQLKKIFLLLCICFINAQIYNYLGSGINMVTEEPTLIRPIQFTINNKIFEDKIRNYTLIIPNEIDIFLDGHNKEKSFIFTSTKEYFYHLYESTQSSGTFTKSRDVQNVINIFKKGTFYYAFLEHIMTIASIKINTESYNLQVTNEFQNDINNLPSNYSKIVYSKFIKKYGTHYIYYANMGGKGIYEMIIDIDYLINFGNDKIKAEMFVDFDWIINYGEENRGHRINSYKDWIKNTEIKTRLIGGDTSRGFKVSDWDKWKETVAYLPSLLNYKVRRLDELINNNIKKNNVKFAINQYINENSINMTHVSNCKHITITNGHKPENYIKELTVIQSFGIKKYYFLVNGPNKHNECIISYSLTDKSNIYNPKYIKSIGIAYNNRVRIISEPNYYLNNLKISAKINDKNYNKVIKIKEWIYVKKNSRVDIEFNMEISTSKGFFNKWMYNYFKRYFFRRPSNYLNGYLMIYQQFKID